MTFTFTIEQDEVRELPRSVALEALVFLNKEDKTPDYEGLVNNFVKSAEYVLSTILCAPVSVKIAVPTAAGGNYLVVFDKLHNVEPGMAEKLMTFMSRDVFTFFNPRGRVEVQFGPLTMKF